MRDNDFISFDLSLFITEQIYNKNLNNFYILTRLNLSFKNTYQIYLTY